MIFLQNVQQKRGDKCMGIKFVIGTSGSGKTHYSRKRAAEIASGGNRAALLVPEQFSFETERAMLQLLPASLADSVEVFSFTRLARDVSRETGGIAGRRLDNSGRAAVMNVAMTQVQDHLSLYTGRKRQDLIKNMLSAVSEFKSCSISPELLIETADKTEDSVLSCKLRELSLIYGAYDAIIANIGSIDPLDDLSRLAKDLELTEYFSGMTVIADSFTGFTRQEMAVLKQIVFQCDEFEITLCCEDPENHRIQNKPDDLFATVYNTVDSLSEFDNDIEFAFLSGHERFKSEALRKVEAGLFRAKHPEPDSENCDGVVVYSAEDKYDETEFVAREIRRLARENAMRWRDFAIICRTDSDYKNQMLRALELQGIPCFCDRRSSVTDMPLVRFVMSAMDIINGRWRSEDIMRWLKTGMLRDVSLIDAARLENYCFVWNIRGKMWKEEFSQSPYGYKNGSDDDDKELLSKINASKECIVNLLNRFEANVKSETATGRDMAAAVYNLIESSGCAERIESMLPKLSPQDAEAQGQVWNLLMNILDQLAAILGDSIISFREFSDLLSLMLGLCDVGEIPQGMDEVVFGSADRIRTSGVRAVFILGANEGVFPKLTESSGVFTDNERKLLISMKLPLSSDSEGTALNEQFIAYSSMTCASESLYVTYSNSCNGEQLYSSEIVSELNRIIPQCKKTVRSDVVTLDMIENDDAGFLLTSASLSDDSELSRALVRVYADLDKYADKMDVVKNAALRSSSLKSKKTLHDKSRAFALFGKNVNISASKAECFYSCKFKYFCQYGMKASPRRKAELNPMEYGSVVHYVLEKMLRDHDIGQLAAKDDLTGITSQYLTDYLNEVMGGADMKSARFIYLFRRLTQSVSVLIRQLGEEFAKSLFVPQSFELPIDGDELKPLNIPLSDGTHISVGGKIDRVDIYNKDGIKYIRVVDYKTGSKEFVLSDILSGLNMQMLIYLDILCDRELSGNRYSPAGVIYSPASLKKISGERGRTSVEDEQRDMLKNNGLIVDDSDVINAMEIGMQKKVDKNSNASIKGGQTFRSSATYVADPAQFDVIRGYIRSLLREMGESLHRGEIEAYPVKGTYDACEYCEYRIMCSQEQKCSGRIITKKSMSETLEQMQEDYDG